MHYKMCVMFYYTYICAPIFCADLYVYTYTYISTAIQLNCIVLPLFLGQKKWSKSQFHSWTYNLQCGGTDCTVKNLRFESHCLGLSSLEPDSDARLKVKDFIWQAKDILARESDTEMGRPQRPYSQASYNKGQQKFHFTEEMWKCSSQRFPT